MKKEINTKPLSGFAELKPAEQILFNKMKNIIEENYKLFGFIPMDNPVIERKEILFAKAGGEIKTQIYDLQKGDDDLALRYDLTVPLARYVADKYGELAFPFKRYQIAKVYRGERPQAGRFREFYQADIDVIGDGELSLNFDAEVIAVVIGIFNQLKVEFSKLGKATLRINNRKLFNGLFEFLNLENKADEIMQAIDKLEKIGEEKVEEIFDEIGLSEDKKKTIFEFLKIKNISDLEEKNIQNEIFQEGVSDLKKVFDDLKQLGISEENFEFDFSIVRGLAYYTGTIYETRLENFPEFGSVCSGGRYENLASEYIDKKLPGVGVSIGLSRLFDQLLKNKVIEPEEATYSKILILPMTENEKEFALDLVSKIRTEKIPAEVDLRFEKKMAKRAKYAEKLKIPFVLFLGEDEVQSEKFALKNFETGEKIEDLDFEKMIGVLKK